MTNWFEETVFLCFFRAAPETSALFPKHSYTSLTQLSLHGDIPKWGEDHIPVGVVLSFQHLSINDLTYYLTHRAINSSSSISGGFLTHMWRAYGASRCLCVCVRVRVWMRWKTQSFSSTAWLTLAWIQFDSGLNEILIIQIKEIQLDTQVSFSKKTNAKI